MKIAAQSGDNSMIGTSAQNSAAPSESLGASLWARISTSFLKIRVNRRRTLRLSETLSLGEKRIVAVVEFDNQRFLIGATQQNITLLQSLGPATAEESTTK
jgi:flagellar biogenesis protein FliO